MTTELTTTAPKLSLFLAECYAGGFIKLAWVSAATRHEAFDLVRDRIPNFEDMILLTESTHVCPLAMKGRPAFINVQPYHLGQ